MRERIPAALAGLCAVLFMGLSVSASDPPPKSDQVTIPRIVASPTTTPPPPVIKPGEPVPLDAGKFLFLDVQGHTGPITWEFSKTGIVALLPDAPAGGVSSGYFPGIKQGESAPAWHKAPSKTAVPCLGVSGGSTTISAWGVLDGRAKKIAELVMQVGPAPPKPDDPKPDDPKPVPVSTFRVILIHESAQNLPPAQNSILYGKDVSDYLTAKTTPESGVAGWRLYDKDTDAANDQSAIAAMWKAVKPKVTTVPAMAVEVNGKVEIVPLPATAAEALTALKKYRGE